MAEWAALQVVRKVANLFQHNCQQKSPHITFKCDQMNWSSAVLRMWLHIEVSAVFARNFINQISVIINTVIMSMMNIMTRLSSNDILHSYDWSNIPHTVTLTQIHHFSEYNLVCRHVDFTVSFVWCFEEAVQFGLSLCNENWFHGQTLIMISTWESR